MYDCICIKPARVLTHTHTHTHTHTYTHTHTSIYLYIYIYIYIQEYIHTKLIGFCLISINRSMKTLKSIKK